jgi:hypothetical protein
MIEQDNYLDQSVIIRNKVYSKYISSSNCYFDEIFVPDMRKKGCVIVDFPFPLFSFDLSHLR